MPELQNIHILLLEDEQPHTELIVRALERHSNTFYIHILTHISEARKYLEVHTPDIVLSDWNLIDGKASELIPPDKHSLRYPFIFMTSHGSESLAVEIMKAGAIDYIVKSSEEFAKMPQTIRRVIREWKNIVQNRESQEALRLSEQKYRRIFEHIQDVYFELDLEGTLTEISPSIEEHSSFTRSELLGTKPELFYQDSHDVNRFLELMRTRKKIHGYTTKLRDKNGVIRYGSVSAQLLEARNDEPAKIVGSIHDITELKLTQQALRDLNEQLENKVTERTVELVEINKLLVGANYEINRQLELLHEQSIKIKNTNNELTKKNEELQKLNNEKNEFLGIAAHDLKNPLTSIILRTRMVRQYFTKMDTESLLNSFILIESTAHRMSEIIKNLLDVNAIESGKINWALQMVNVSQIVLDKIREYDSELSRKNISIVNHVQDDIIFLTLEIGLQQVVDNLISNAIKYTSLNSTVTVRLSLRDDKLVFEVEDEGNGIPESEQNLLFQKFARLSVKPTGGENSTGLGLSIVHRLVTMMNGTVSCSSEVGKGSIFTVILPRIDQFSTNDFFGLIM